MKRLLTILLCIMLPIGLTAQARLSAQEQEKILDRIESSASATASMQCEFTQTKTMKMLKGDMKSSGVMYFRKPDKLRWQYNSPYKYIFILNGGKVKMESTSSSQSIDVKQNKMFRQIADIMLGSITGGGLKNSSDFTVEIFREGDSHYARLLPKKKEIKQIYEAIEICFNPSLTMVSSVRMKEKTGDETIVKLLNVRSNGSFDDKFFDTD
ncbi:MAG: outer membrane lipoprotein carrier protein LolA [Bacteroidales bacterium]|nr:outer membrane lipoprotein carrier protein LolA [Bacteroidales bacterium]